MRLAKAFVILAVAAAACAPQAGQVGSSAFASAEPSSPSPSSISLASPSPLVSLPPTAAPCPTESPMSVARYLHADPACFGARDVTLTGWEDLPEGLGGVDLGIEPSWLATTSPPWAFLMDRLGQECGQGCGSLAVHVDPSSALRFERDGHWVVVTGHRNDPRAETCVAPASGDPGTPTHEEIVQTCRNAFVLTSVRDAVAPSGALPSCPSDAALRIAAYLDADPACFAGRDVTLVGWEDTSPAIGLMPPGIEPAWLWGLSVSSVYDAEQTAGAVGECPTDDTVGCRWMMVLPNPASGITFEGRNRRWVRITGHREDAIAETCHYVYPPDWGAPPPFDDVEARRICRGTFVLTSVVKTTAPASPAP